MFIQPKTLYTIVPIILSLILQLPVFGADLEELGAISRNDTKCSQLFAIEGYIPPVIIIQAQVHPTFYEDPDVVVNARGHVISLYKNGILNLPRCISQMKIILDYFVPEVGKCQDWIRHCQIPEVLLEKQYDVLEKGLCCMNQKIA
mgnify:CR=1 FL=1